MKVENTKTREYDGKRFVVYIKRDTARRRYVLSTYESDGLLSDQNEPLYLEEFVRYYEFYPEWPHEKFIEDILE
ncbi:hypothetical protein HN681_00190 [archaeon]|jgi:hypothetical protein|nr:hypothetical protein [archaeon]MBT3730507.1 hypothetical protein [archaeon]MBT4669427.1 hypothetical protein [archaeon]MBT5029820.1 hypothetical protein [archaeon]MBT5288033.1 hypothetical protein [archaeon]